ncbi:hypothetical protein CLIM01_14777 [Colletotrichum limetticola]|uniref:Uncharacterized protein n=1 Tax=Colletotrichum limetticola TaxID=1209924 RepID=A0ABQ9P9J8_9PEZI|nr:hypothetical protein CLIM01_14777 [Colletotrichum limetticola]
MGERTGSRVLQWVWSYVKASRCQVEHEVCSGRRCGSALNFQYHIV